MEKQLWHDHYAPGIQPEINTEAYSSIVDLFEKKCAEYANKTAYVSFDVSITYAELEQKTRDFAAYLQNDLGLKKGDAIAVMMPNLLQYPIVVFGAHRAGCAVVNTNPMYTTPELEHQLNDSGAKAIVCIENTAHVLAEVVDKTPVEKVIIARVGDMLGFPKGPLINFALKHVKKVIQPWSIANTIDFNTAMKSGASSTFTPTNVTLADTAFLQYTGGTTGVSKGAILSHRNMIANVLQSSEWLKNDIKPGEEVIATALPLYHIFALTANCMTYLNNGAKNILIADPRDPMNIIKEFDKHNVTVFTGVNTLFNSLLNTPEFLDLMKGDHKLRFSLGGGAAVQKAVSQKWKEVTGNPIIEAYGLTETSPAVCMNRCDDPKYGSIGLPIPSTLVACMDDDNNEVPQGERGELCVKGPQVMEGYLNRKDATLETIKDGWLHTGDIAVMDEKGYFQIVDRKKDMIIVSGFNVFPNEIEDVLAKHDGVLECACIGVPDDRSGEAIKVFIVKKDPSLTADAIKAHCKESVTGYKVPKHIEFRDELPKSNVGKILRKDLRAEEDAKRAAG